MTIRERENYVYSGIIVVCVVFFVWIIPANTPQYPGYGLPTTLIPNLAVGFIMLLAVLQLIKNVLLWRVDKNPTNEVLEKDKVRLVHLAKFMIPCILAMPAMKWLGFIPASAAFLVVLQLLCGERSLWKLAVVTIGVVAFMYAAMTLGGLPTP